MRQRFAALRVRLALLVLLASVPALGLFAIFAVSAARRGWVEALLYTCLLVMLSLSAAWVGGNLFVLRGLNLILATTRRLAEGDFTARTGLGDASGEIGTLGRLFDGVAEMFQRHVESARHQAQTLREQAAALDRAQSELERRVGERTAELVQAKEQSEAEVARRRCTEEELRKAIETAKAATQAKSIFLAGMSHELRTPLNGVIGMIGLMLKTPLNEQQLKYATVARTSADSLLALISDILDFSKLEASGIELEAAPFSPRKEVEAVLETFAPRAAEKGLELDCRFQDELPATVRGDAHRLRQVLNNLISNAVKFTHSGRVTVHASVEREISSHVLLRFCVSDTGIGMSRQGMERLFQPFTQADASISRSFGGTGLGLAICKGLVELMGGQIEVESEPGARSTFRFTVVLEKEAPAAKAAHAAGTEAGAPAASDAPAWGKVPAAIRKLRALIVGRNPTSRDIVHGHLADWKIAADAAPDVETALRMLRDAAAAAAPFGLVIIDVHPDSAEALQLAGAVKAGQWRELRDTLLLAVTPIGDMVKPAQWKAGGFAGVVTKPLLPSRLLDAITEAVAPGARSSPAGAPAATVLRADGVRVLLAEDNETNQLVATEILSAVGFTCDVVSNGKQAVEAALSGKYDLVLMDCQMPEMDGVEAARLIRQHEAARLAAANPTNPADPADPATVATPITSALPPADGAPESGARSKPPRKLLILALTANATKSDREQALAVGMDGYLTKPIDPDRLIESIRTFLPDAVRPVAAPVAPSAPPSVPSALSALSALSAPSAPDAPLALEAILARCLNNVTLVGKLLTKFEADLSRDVEEIDRSLARGDVATAVRLSHGLKGVAASMSAEPLRRLAAEVETLLRGSDVQVARDRLTPLRAEARRCTDCIPELRARLGRAPVQPPAPAAAQTARTAQAAGATRACDSPRSLTRA